jgi:hypothetical protein
MFYDGQGNVRVLICFSHPDDDLLRASIDLAHELHLRTPFIQIILVNAHSINPVVCRERTVSQSEESMVQVFTYPKQTRMNLDIVEFIRLRWHVRFRAEIEGTVLRI